MLSISVKGRLEHAVSGEILPEWRAGEEVESAVDVDMGDYVLYNDWVGQVCYNFLYFRVIMLTIL